MYNVNVHVRMYIYHTSCVLQRYKYYVTEGVPESHLAPFQDGTFPAVQDKLPQQLLKNAKWEELLQSLRQEIIEVHAYAPFPGLKTGHVDFLLLICVYMCD